MDVLLVKMSSLGDIVHTLPAVRDASRHGVTFDWVVEEGFEPIAALAPGVRNVFPIALRRWRKKPTAGFSELRALRRRIRGHRYDLVLDAQGLVKSAMVSRWAHADAVIGPDRATARERLATIAYQHGFPMPRNIHAVDRLRAWFAAAIDYDEPDTPADFGLAASTPPGDDVLLLHGTTWPTKHWPEPFWIDLGRRIAARGLNPVVTWGTDQEQARAQRIIKAIGAGDVYKRMDLSHAVGFLSGMRAIVGTDTGLAHLGAALGRPTVMLFGPTDPNLTGGRGPGAVNLQTLFSCAPCLSKTCARQEQGDGPMYPPCFAMVAVDRVWDSLVKML